MTRLVVQVRAEVPVSVSDPANMEEIAQAASRALGPMNVTVWEIEDIEEAETQEAAAPDDYARPGWRMFPVL